LFAELLDTIFAAEYAVAVAGAAEHHPKDPSLVASELSRIRALYASHLTGMGIFKSLFEARRPGTLFIFI
jgi:hypothetical protein